MSKFSEVVTELMADYGLTDAEAIAVYELGCREQQELTIRGHKFESGTRAGMQSDDDREYYINVYGPDERCVCRMHHDDSS